MWPKGVLWTDGGGASTLRRTRKTFWCKVGNFPLFVVGERRPMSYLTATESSRRRSEQPCLVKGSRLCLGWVISNDWTYYAPNLTNSLTPVTTYKNLRSVWLQ